MADLWGLVWGKPEVDPALLAEAVEREAARGDLDFRTRLLIRDSTDALAEHWGAERLRAWLERSPVRDRIEGVRREDLGERGFPFLREALVDRTEPNVIRQFLRELGAYLSRPVKLTIGGSGALILTGHLSRATQDVDVVDEVPEPIRAERALLDQLARRYRLHLTHFQSHFLPAGWEARLHSLEPFGQIQAYLIDVLDLFLSKLFSKRDKDLDDLRALLPALERGALVQRLQDTCGALLGERGLRANAERNWYVLTGEALPARE